MVRYSNSDKRQIREWVESSTDYRNIRSFRYYQQIQTGVSMSMEDVYTILYPIWRAESDQYNLGGVITQFTTDFNRLITGQETEITVPSSLLTDNLEIFFQTLNTNTTQRYLLRFGNRIFPITQGNIEKVRALMEGDEDAITSGSDRELLEANRDGIDIFLTTRQQQENIIQQQGLLIETDTDTDDEAPQGSWFPYWLRNDLPINLVRYDIHKSEETVDNEQNCLLKALRASGLDKKKLEFCKCLFKNRSIPEKDLVYVSSKIDIGINIWKITKGGIYKKYKKYKGNPEKVIDIYNSEKHYYLKEPLPSYIKITSYALNHWDEIKDQEDPHLISRSNEKGGKTYYERNPNGLIKDSSKLVLLLIKNKDKLLKERKITMELLESQYYDKSHDFETLEYDETVNCKSNTDWREKKFNREKTPPVGTYLFDFETLTSIDKPKMGSLGINVWSQKEAEKKMPPHIPYCLCYGEFKDNLDMSEIKVFKQNAGRIVVSNQPNMRYETTSMNKEAKFNRTDFRVWLNEIARRHYPNGDDEASLHRPCGKIRIIAHNAGYDVRFIKKYFKEYQSIDKGKRLISGTGLFEYYPDYGKNWKDFRAKDKMFCVFEIRDSLGLIPVGLGKFGGQKGIFPTIPQEKEIIPYSFYNPEKVGYSDWGTKKINPVNQYKDSLHDTLDNILKLEEFKSDEDKERFIKNVEDWDCMRDDGMIDMVKYSSVYCKYDIKVLNDGLLQYREAIRKITEKNDFGYEPLDALDYLTLPSLVYDILLINGCFEDTFQISGVPQQFIQRCVVGGRCMLKNNEPQYFEEHKVDGVLHSLQDYDAVSCYTSAFVRMKGLLKGMPFPIKDSKLEYIFKTTRRNNDYINSLVDAYFIKIRITKINKKRQFPVISCMSGGKRNWSNNLEGCEIYCDNLALDDFIEFQGVEFEIIEGYYYADGFNPKIVEVMERLFINRIIAKNEISLTRKGDNQPYMIMNEFIQERAKKEGIALRDCPNLIGGWVKDEIKILTEKDREFKKYHNDNNFDVIKKYKNPIQEIYKLLLNSGYGKMLLKEIETESEYIKKYAWKKDKQGNWKRTSPWLKYLKRHYNKIRDYMDLGDEVKVNSILTIHDHFNNVHQGVQVLSYAKRLMNEVICLAEELGLDVLYTDTDSIHIVDKHIPILEEAFRKKYGRELRGENLNQFNEDFDTNIPNARSSKFIGLAKKCYLDTLKGEGKDVDYHIRMKSIPNPSIMREADRRGLNPEELYDELWNSTRVSFDLLKKQDNTVKLRFVFNDDWTVANETNFSRSLIFNNDRKKNLTEDIIKGKNKYWKGDKKDFKEWSNHNNTMLNLLSERKVYNDPVLSS
jgi:hypothetical protein